MILSERIQREFQFKEKILVNGEEYILANRPLDKLLNTIDSTLNYNPFEISTDKDYTASWFIKNNTLYLERIEFTDGFRFKEELESILFRSESLITGWYSGVLIAYGGEPIWFRNGVDPVYEKELIFKIENGVVVDHEVVKNELPF